MEIVGETNFIMSFFSSILFRLPNLLNLIIYFLVIYALILLIKCLKITKCPLEEIGIGSVKPCINAKKTYFKNSIILSP